MGEPKLLKTAGGKTIFEITLDHHLASSLPRVCAVVPGWLDDFGPLIAHCASGRVSFVMMDKPCEMASSLKAGWEYLRCEGAFDGIMVSLADQPLVTAGTIDGLIRSFSLSARPICVPVFSGRRGHPVIIGRDLDREVLSLEGDEGARSLLRKHEDDIEEVPLDSDEVLRDFDTPEDLAGILTRLSGNG